MRPHLGASLVGTAVVAAGCGLSALGGPAPIFGGPREDVVVVGGYGEIVAMSASERLLFVAGADGLAIHDMVLDRWLPPLAPENGFPARGPVTVVADPQLDAVWIGAPGEVVLYRPEIDQLIRAIVPGRPEWIVFDRDDPSAGAYVGTAGTWTLVTRAGVALPVRPADTPPPARQWTPVDLDDLVGEYPSLRSFAGLLTRDAALRPWPVSTGASPPGRSDAWIGTLGGGVYMVDPLFNRARHVAYGLFESGASSLALASDGVWIGSEGTDFRGTGGVVSADIALQQWDWLRGPSDGSMSGARVNDILVREGVLWAATSRGVAARTTRAGTNDGFGAGDAWRWIVRGDADRAHALAARGDAIWIGGDRGLRVVRASGISEGGIVESGNGAVRALVIAGDTLWAGTDGGLMVLRPSSPDARLMRATIAGAGTLVGRRIRSLARADSVLAVATDEAVMLIDLGTRAVVRGRETIDARDIAPLSAVAIDGRSLWIAGDRGLVHVDRSNGIARSFPGPGRPGEPVHDVAVQGEVVWLATSSGVVRLRASLAR